jgi:glucose/mannose-6-phosphate isomerase
MIDSIKNFPEICKDSIEKSEKITIPDYEFDKILVCGMGGSAIGGDLLKDLLRNRISNPIEVSRQYHPPAYVDENTLTFFVSYSGNTEETLSQFVGCVKRKCKIIGITSNGKLKKWCEKFNLPFILVPKGYQPRAALPYLFFPMLICLKKLSVIDLTKEINETIQVLKNMKLNGNKKIALLLKDSIPAIYASDGFATVAKRIKTQFNENSKVPARYDVFPELNHNEIVGFENETLNENHYIIILRDKNESKSMKTRIEVTKKLIEDKVKGIYEIWAQGESNLAKTMSLIFIGDVLSYELAMLNKVDPEGVESIRKLKEQLKKKVNLTKELEKEIIKLDL